jgi:hypothetical protein
MRRRNFRWQFAPVPDLAVALVGATSPERPVLPPWWLPPTLIYYRGGFLRRPPPRWQERPHLVAQWCRLHRLAGQCQILPPSNPLETNATRVPPTSYLPATSTSRSQSIYWMGLGGGAVFIVFWYIPLEDQFPFFSLVFLSRLLDSVLLDHLPSRFFGSLRPSPIVFPIPFWLRHLKLWGGVSI